MLLKIVQWKKFRLPRMYCASLLRSAVENQLFVLLRSLSSEITETLSKYWSWW
jgi:hypothetical protein